MTNTILRNLNLASTAFAVIIDGMILFWRQLSASNDDGFTFYFLYSLLKLFLLHLLWIVVIKMLQS